MTIEERLDALEAEIRSLREQLQKRPNGHDYSGTTSSTTERSGEPSRPRGYARHFGFGLPDVKA